MTCKDCLHYEACRDSYDGFANEYENYGFEFDEFDEEDYGRAGCLDFTARSEWVHLPCERVYFICDKNTKYAMIMSKSIKDLSIREIEKIDKSGYYFSTKEKAEKALEK
jgi:hypothetical protein